MTQAVKILVCGDVKGQFKQLFSRVETVNKKAGPFTVLFCVGEFFDAENDAEWQMVLSGEVTAPLTTYILGPTKPSSKSYISDTSGCELCPNITYLGRKGVYTFSSGLTAVYLGDLDSCTDGLSDSDVRFTSDDIDKIRLPLTSGVDFKGIDLLLTSQWPKGVDKYGNNIDGDVSAIQGSALVSQLALSVKPRYHFSALEGISYERVPYRNHQVLQGDAEHVTRFIALADVGNKDKRKYLYAFTICPMKHMDVSELRKQPPDVTEPPYRSDSSLFKSTAPKKEEKQQQFFYDQKALDNRKRRSDTNSERPFKKHAQPAAPSGPCWFCLASPQVEKHLVISVGQQCYLALAKGGLTPDHCLIIPIGHHQSTTSAPNDVLTELDQYKSSLRKYFSSLGKEVVFFERNYKTQHLQIQVVPLPSSICRDLAETITGFAAAQDIELAQVPQFSNLREIVPGMAPYFFIELPDGERFLYRIKKGFPIQFGREVLAHSSILNMPDRADWKNCQSSKEEETKMAAAFRQGFQKFDFTLS